MIVRCYLILGKKSNGVVIPRRVTRSRPKLDYDEALVRLKLELPEDAFDAPLFTVPVEKRELAVAVEAESPLDVDESAGPS